MKFEKTFLRSKVAQRIFLLFVACALVPIAALAILGFTQVTKQIKEQSYRRLEGASKEWGMDILKGLRLRENEMKMLASTLEAGSSSSPKTLSQEFSAPSRKKVQSYSPHLL